MAKPESAMSRSALPLARLMDGCRAPSGVLAKGRLVPSVSTVMDLFPGFVNTYISLKFNCPAVSNVAVICSWSRLKGESSVVDSYMVMG